MSSPDGYFHLAYNGEVYNYPELRRQLSGKGYRFFSQGDTEVILKAYAEWGEACVDRLVGMFAFAIWDIRRRTLFLARDRLGIKPLYYSRCGGNCFRFASNTQALLEAPDLDTDIDPVALHHQLTLHGVVPAPLTIVKCLRKLPPATTRSTSSRRSCPTSPAHTSPVTRSNEKRHGFRKP